MKKAILIVLSVFLFQGCALTRKIDKNKESITKTKNEKETKTDSISLIEKTAPTENEISFDLKSLNEMLGDFKQKISSGNGSQSTIEKRGGKLIVKSNTAGSEKKQTNVEKSEKEFRYSSEYVLEETKKVIKKMPWQFWMIVSIAIVIFYRKFIFQILTAIFPALGSKRIVSLFLGTYKK